MNEPANRYYETSRGNLDAMTRMAGTAARAESLLGASVVSTTSVAGGDVSTATRLRLTDGRNAMIKTRPHAPEDFFRREAEGLRWLQDADGVPIPNVLAVDDECLIIDWIEPGRPQPDVADQFGRALAATHQAGATQYGGAVDGYIGLAPLPNRPSETWADFYATRRVMPYVRAAVDRGSLEPSDAQPIEDLMRSIAQFAGPEEGPARIHGDLWSGNIVWGEQAWLIDPAAHGGHRETDLAMLALFGVPHLQRIIDSYNEAHPLTDGWRDRVALHQLHPLLVHALMFGGGYGARAAHAARSMLETAS